MGKLRRTRDKDQDSEVQSSQLDRTVQEECTVRFQVYSIENNYVLWFCTEVAFRLIQGI